MKAFHCKKCNGRVIYLTGLKRWCSKCETMYDENENLKDFEEKDSQATLGGFIL